MTTSLTPKSIDCTELALRIYHETVNWSIERRRALIATLHTLIFNLAKRAGAIEHNRKGFYTIVTARLGYFLSEQEMSMPLTWVEQYVRSFWGKCSRTTIRIVLNWLAKLLGFCTDSELHSRRPLAFAELDAEKLLRVYEIVEEQFIGDFGWEALPEHKGASVRDLFNAVFPHSFGFRRKEQEEVAPQTDEDWKFVRQEQARRSIEYKERLLKSFKEMIRGVIPALDDTTYCEAITAIDRLNRWFKKRKIVVQTE